MGDNRLAYLTVRIPHEQGHVWPVRIACAHACTCVRNFVHNLGIASNHASYIIIHINIRS